MGGCWCGGDAKRERVAARRDGSVFGKVIRSHNSLTSARVRRKPHSVKRAGAWRESPCRSRRMPSGYTTCWSGPVSVPHFPFDTSPPTFVFRSTSAHQLNNPRNDPIVGSGSARWCAPCWTTPRGDVWTPASTSRTSGTPPSVGRTRWSSTTWTLAPTTR